MPQFRNDKPSAPFTLTQAVTRVLKRACQNESRFAVFVVDGKPVLSNVESALFKRMEKRWPEKMVAIYGPMVSVMHVIEDLSEYFPDEARA